MTMRDWASLSVGTTVIINPHSYDRPKKATRTFEAKIMGYDFGRTKYQIDRFPGGSGRGRWIFPSEIVMVHEPTDKTSHRDRRKTELRVDLRYITREIDDIAAVAQDCSDLAIRLLWKLRGELSKMAHDQGVELSTINREEIS